jgi:hypothetical protein
MSRRSAAPFVLLLALASWRCPPFAPERIALGDFELATWEATVCELDDGTIERRFGAHLANGGPAAADVALLVSSTDPEVTVVDAPLAFGAIPRGDTVQHRFGYVVRHSPGVAFELALLAFAVESEVARDVAGWELDPPGRWWTGDLHVHATGASNDTGGNSFPEDIRAIARERGLDFVVLTDHSNSTGPDPDEIAELPELFNQGPEFPYWELAEQLSVPGEFLLIDGNELSPRRVGSAPNGHVGCIPADLESFDRTVVFEDRPYGAFTGAQTLAQARAAGCWTILNHPYAGLPWIAFDWTSVEYDAIEIWNGGLGIGLTLAELRARDAWRCDMLAGRSVTPIGSSDNHRVFIDPPGAASNPALGYPITAVFARELTWPAIMAGLRASQVSVGEGASRLFLDGYDAGRLRAEGADTRELRVRGALDPESPDATLRVTVATACADVRPVAQQPATPLPPPTVTEAVLFETSVAAGASFDFGVVIDAAPGVYSATLIPNAPQPVHFAAFSRAVVVR